MRRHAAAEPGLVDAVADRGDRAHVLVARHDGALERRFGVAAARVVDDSQPDAAGLDADEELARARARVVRLEWLEPAAQRVILSPRKARRCTHRRT